MIYTNFENGDTRADIRTKINTLGSNTVSEIASINIKDNEQDVRLDTIEDSIDMAYCCYASEPSLLLNNTLQRLTTYSEIITPENITLTNGIFQANKSGLYEWHLERGYTNNDTQPSSPIALTIEIRKNGSNVVYSRTATLGAATANDEPSVVNFTSPFIMNVLFEDTFEFYFRASEGGVNPSSTFLNRVQLSARRIG